MKYTEAQIEKAIKTTLHTLWGGESSEAASKLYQTAYNAVYKAGILVMLQGITNTEWVGPADAIVDLVSTFKISIQHSHGAIHVLSELGIGTIEPIDLKHPDRGLRTVVTTCVKNVLARTLAANTSPGELNETQSKG